MVFPQHTLSRALLRAVRNPAKTAPVQFKRGQFDPYLLFPVKFLWNQYENHDGQSVFDRDAVKHYQSRYRYQELGLLYEDCVVEEHPLVREAISRLPKPILEARQARIDRALMLLTSKKTLPKELHTTHDIDIPYLAPYLFWVESEAAEIDAFIGEFEDISLPPNKAASIADYDNHSGVRRITKIRMTDAHDHGYKISKSTSGHWWH